MATNVSNNVDAAAEIFASLNSKRKTEISASDEAQDRFLKLYVTQLKNQDPLNPLDNAQVTSQLAQMNTVKGIEALNATMTKLMEAFTGSQTLQAAGVIGKSVLVPGSDLQLRNGVAGGGFDLPQAVDGVKVKIIDGNGLTVRTLNLGAQEAGSSEFVWDGKTDSGAAAVDGNYKFRIEATDTGKSVSATALELGTVSAVIRTGGGFQLELGEAGTVSMSDVRRIL